MSKCNVNYFIDLLQPPANVELTIQWNNDLLQAILSWEQPFTLNITDQGYDRNITYTVFVSRNSTLEVYNTSATQFICNLDHSAIVFQSNGDICKENILQTFQVVAINRVGTGQRSELIYLRDVLCTSGFSPLYTYVHTQDYHVFICNRFYNQHIHSQQYNRNNSSNTNRYSVPISCNNFCILYS